MRKSNYKLNVIDIYNAADLNKFDRCKYLKILKSRNVITLINVKIEKKHFWIIF